MFKRELRLIITESCNYNCSFCHKEGLKKSERSVLDKDDYTYLFNICKENFNWDEVTITGGEPFVRKDIAEIIESIYKSNGIITVVTNGELLNKNVGSLKYISRINISIHTLDDCKYHEIIGKEDKFKKVLQNIAVIRNIYPELNIRLNSVIIKGLNDSKKDIKEYIDFAKKVKASIKFVELYSQNKDQIVSIEEIANVLRDIGFKHRDISNISKQELTDGETLVVLSRIFCSNANMQHDPESYCHNYNDLFITPEGKINICRESKDDIDIYNEIKTRNKNELVKKIDLAINNIGANCPYNKEKKKLAINGGPKLFSKTEEARFIHPKITKEIEEAVIDQLNTEISIYDNSDIFGKFEMEFAKYHEKKHALTFSSGTAALWGMYEGIELKEGDEIICPCYTFFATVTPILFTKATPVLVDCGEDGNIDPVEISKHITSKTKAIVVTHMWGYPCKMDEIKKIADKYGIYLLEDCSHAHGAKYKNKKIGFYSDAAVFSLQGQKIITGGEGGILITNNKKIKDRALILGHYNKRCKVEIDKSNELYKYYVTGKGMKLRAHPIAIRIAYEQFKNLNEINKIKNEYAKLIIKELKGVKGIRVMEPNDDCVNSWYSIIIKYDENKMYGVTRERFVEALRCEGAIEVDIPNSTCPINMLELFKNPDEIYPEYKEKIKHTEDQFIMAKKFYNSIIKLPVWYGKEDIGIVIKYIRVIKKVCNNIKELI